MCVYECVRTVVAGHLLAELIRLEHSHSDNASVDRNSPTPYFSLLLEVIQVLISCVNSLIIYIAYPNTICFTIGRGKQTSY